MRHLEHQTRERDLYRLVVSDARPDSFDITLLVAEHSRSGVVVTSSHVINLTSNHYAVPSVQTELELDDRPLTVLATHLLPPSNPSYAAARDRQLRAATDWVAKQPVPLVLIGVLNTTRFSLAFRPLSKRVGLVKSQRGYGFFRVGQEMAGRSGAFLLTIAFTGHNS